MLRSLHQSSLDDVIIHEPKQLLFTTAGLMDHLIELIVCEDEVGFLFNRIKNPYCYSGSPTSKAFHLVDQGTFHHLLRFCHPSLMEKDIPHRKTVRAEILQHASLSEERVHEKLKNLPCKVSFTYDAWTSQPGDPYLSITGHYINAPPSQPDDWELKTERLAFEEIKGHHTGKSMAEIISHTVEHYELQGKVNFIDPLCYCYKTT